MKRLFVLLGGRAAEEIVLDQMTTGAGNDIERSACANGTKQILKTTKQAVMTKP